MPLTHPFWCLPSTCKWAAVTGQRETRGDREERGEGAKEGITGACLFCKADRKLWSAEVGSCWATPTVTFLGGKQPSLVNLEWLWLWNHLDSFHIVDWQRRNALQQFMAALWSNAAPIWNDRSIWKCLQFKVSSFVSFFFWKTMFYVCVHSSAKRTHYTVLSAWCSTFKPIKRVMWLQWLSTQNVEHNFFKEFLNNKKNSFILISVLRKINNIIKPQC